MRIYQYDKPVEDVWMWECPTAPGKYLVYGWPDSSFHLYGPPKLFTITISQNAHYQGNPPNLVCQCEGRFIFSNKVRGVWCSNLMADPPKYLTAFDLYVNCDVLFAAYPTASDDPLREILEGTVLNFMGARNESVRVRFSRTDGIVLHGTYPCINVWNKDRFKDIETSKVATEVTYPAAITAR